MDDGSGILIQFIALAIIGAICAAIANSKGRSGVGWFFVGFFTGCIGIIIILCMSNENERLERERVQDDVNRRLREQLRQEQMKIDALRAHTAARLDAHDEALGVNTRAAAPALLSAAPPMANLPGGPQNLASQPAPQDDGTEWYYVEGGSTQQGPMSIIALRSAIAQGRVNGDTLVWHEGMQDWGPARHHEKLSSYFNL